MTQREQQILDSIDQHTAKIRRQLTGTEAIDSSNPMYEPAEEQPDYRVALVVGHEPKRPGACNKLHNICEFRFNRAIAEMMTAIQPPGFRFMTVYRDAGDYSGLPAKINGLDPDLILSLHANASNEGTVSGTETLYAKGSTRSRIFAGHIQKRIVQLLGLRDRNLKPTDRRDNGGHVLHSTNGTCALAEPFFIDNNSDWSKAQSLQKEIAQAYVSAIEAYRVEAQAF